MPRRLLRGLTHGIRHGSDAGRERRSPQGTAQQWLLGRRWWAQRRRGTVCVAHGAGRGGTRAPGGIKAGRTAVQRPGKGEGMTATQRRRYS